MMDKLLNTDSVLSTVQALDSRGGFEQMTLAALYIK
jgi:hypothetical protein